MWASTQCLPQNTADDSFSFVVFCFVLICIIADQYSSALGNGLSSLAYECTHTTFRPVVSIPVWVSNSLLYSLPSLWWSV